MAERTLILIGGGGHCKSCIDVIEAGGQFKIEGILDTPANLDKEVSGYKVIGTDADIPKLALQGHHFLLTMGDIARTGVRKQIYNQLKELKAHLPVIISPRAYVSKKATIGNGTIVMHDALVNAFATIAENNIINTRASIEHDAEIGNHCHISTHSVINGGADIGNEVFIGSGSVVSNNVSIPSNTIIGAGTVIYKAIFEAGTYAGNPFRKLNG